MLCCDILCCWVAPGVLCCAVMSCVAGSCLVSCVVLRGVPVMCYVVMSRVVPCRALLSTSGTLTCVDLIQAASSQVEAYECTLSLMASEL